MSCPNNAKKCNGAMQAAGAPATVETWAGSWKPGDGHCPKCGGFLDAGSQCNQCGGAGRSAMFAARRKPSIPRQVYTDLDEYKKDNRLPPNRDIEQRWRDRVEANGWQYQSDGADRYLRQYGRSIGETKVRQLATKAENEGYQRIADGFWQKAHDLHEKSVGPAAWAAALKQQQPGAAAQSQSNGPILPPKPASSGNGYCPDCGGELRVKPGEEDWCGDCMDMVTAAPGATVTATPQSSPAPAPTTPQASPPPTPAPTQAASASASSPAQPAQQSTQATSPTSPAAMVKEYAQSARNLQDERPGPKRNQIQGKVQSIGYSKIRSALKSVGVPSGSGATDENITNMVWQYLDRCPTCKAWISPRNGICNNPRCADGKNHKRVGAQRNWPPSSVRWVPYKEEVGQVVKSGQAHQQSAIARGRLKKERERMAEKIAERLAQGSLAELGKKRRAEKARKAKAAREAKKTAGSGASSGRNVPLWARKPLPTSDEIDDWKDGLQAEYMHEQEQAGEEVWWPSVNDGWDAGYEEARALLAGNANPVYDNDVAQDAADSWAVNHARQSDEQDAAANAWQDGYESAYDGLSPWAGNPKLANPNIKKSQQSAPMPGRVEVAGIAYDGMAEYAARREQAGWDDLSEIEKDAWTTGFNAYQARMAAGQGRIPDDEADAEIVMAAEKWTVVNVEEDDHHHAEPAYANGFRTAREKLAQHADEYVRRGGSQCGQCGNFISADGQGHKAGCGVGARIRRAAQVSALPPNEELADDFTKDLPRMKAGRVKSTLNKLVRVGGVVMPRRQHIRTQMEKGSIPKTKEVPDKIKINRLKKYLDENSQWAGLGNPDYPPAKEYLEKKAELEASPKKTEYRLVDEETRSFYDVTKTEYEFARYLRDRGAETNSFQPATSNGKSMFDDFKDRLAAAGKKYGTEIEDDTDSVLDWIDNGRNPEAVAFSRKVEELAISDLPGVHPGDVLERLGGDDEIISYMQNGTTPDGFIDEHCKKYDLDRLSDIRAGTANLQPGTEGSPYQSVGKTIYDQMGGNKLTGAIVITGGQKVVVGDKDHLPQQWIGPDSRGAIDLDYGMAWSPNVRGRNVRMVVTAQPDDTYTAFVWKGYSAEKAARNNRMGEVLMQQDGIYNDNLTDVVDGMYVDYLKQHEGGVGIPV